jgi:nucleoside-diphosphate-sugar epimerase
MSGRLKTLVTGGTGFIGSHLAERLLAEGHYVRLLVRDSQKGQWLQQRGAELAAGDISGRQSLRGACEKIDVVFHLAARVSEWGRWAEFQTVTVDGTANILSAAVEAGVPRFVHVSTAVVYDDRFARRARFIAEDAPLGDCGDRAYANYAKSKVHAEHLVWQFHEERRIAATVIRPAWVYGERDFTLLPRLIEHLRGPLACWIGRADPVVDPIHVTDVADCAYRAATSDAAIGQSYNVAPLDEIRLRTFVGALCAEIGISPPRWSLPYPIAAAATAACETWARLVRQTDAPPLTRAGLASLTVDQHFDASKAVRELGWRPRVSLENGVRRTAAWYLAQSRTPLA